MTMVLFSKAIICKIYSHKLSGSFSNQDQNQRKGLCGYYLNKFENYQCLLIINLLDNLDNLHRLTLIQKP